jgi:two-component system, NtrC family, response regulator GlrR
MLLAGHGAWRLEWVRRADDLPAALDDDPPSLVLTVPSPGQLGRWLDVLAEHLPDSVRPVPVMALLAQDPPDADVARLTEVADFEVAPWRVGDVRLRLGRLLAGARARSVGEIAGRLAVRLGLDGVLGEDGGFGAVKARLPLVARADATVLISGETGTGKEVVARAIHYLSPRAEEPFLPVNCGAIPVELFENELFGHRRGAFTDARQSVSGVIAEAEGGTLFLDEVDAVPPLAQTKLLQFLQHQAYRPLGSPTLRRANVRIVAASNADLEAAVAKGTLRQDLYYRLNIIPIALPPLRERPGDIPLLARHFLEKHGGPAARDRWRLAPGALDLLRAYPWPGNVRELENVMHQVVALTPPGLLGPEALPLRLRRCEPARSPRSFREAKAQAVAAFERDYVERLLSAHHGNVTRAAREARKDRRAFGRLLQKYGVDRSASPEVRRSG